ncbi:unnamed protein product, partial [Meganyctiphanes norvegica]
MEVSGFWMSLLATIGALLFSMYYILENLVLALIPNKFLMKDITGDIVLCTGGGSGIGRLMCLKLAKKGAKIVTWDVNAEGNAETARQIKEAGGVCHAYTVDLCDRQAIYKCATTVKQEVGKVDILINNAGIVTGRNFKDSPDELIQRTFDVNIMSHFWTTKSFINEMMSSNKGHIVTVASVAGYSGVNKLADYCSSKFAAVGFDESLRLEMMVKYRRLLALFVMPFYDFGKMYDDLKLSMLLPILEPEYVAQSSVDGILTNKVEVLLPGTLRILLILKVILPEKALFILGRATGITCSMDEFKGRKKTQ